MSHAAEDRHDRSKATLRIVTSYGFRAPVPRGRHHRLQCLTATGLLPAMPMTPGGWVKGQLRDTAYRLAGSEPCRLDAGEGRHLSPAARPPGSVSSAENQHGRLPSASRRVCRRAALHTSRSPSAKTLARIFSADRAAPRSTPLARPRTRPCAQSMRQSPVTPRRRVRMVDGPTPDPRIGSLFSLSTCGATLAFATQADGYGRR